MHRDQTDGSCLSGEEDTSQSGARRLNSCPASRGCVASGTRRDLSEPHLKPDKRRWHLRAAAGHVAGTSSVSLSPPTPPICPHAACNPGQGPSHMLSRGLRPRETLPQEAFSVQDTAHVRRVSAGSSPLAAADNTATSTRASVTVTACDGAACPPPAPSWFRCVPSTSRPGTCLPLLTCRTEPSRHRPCWVGHRRPAAPPPRGGRPTAISVVGSTSGTVRTRRPWHSQGEPGLAAGAPEVRWAGGILALRKPRSQQPAFSAVSLTRHPLVTSGDRKCPETSAPALPPDQWRRTLRWQQNGFVRPRTVRLRGGRGTRET